MKYWLIALLIILASTASQALNTQEQRWVEAVRNTYGDRAGKRVETWRREMEQFKGLSERQKLTEVNNFFNQLNFVNDDRLWGKKDYWATPLEFLGSNAGDCEDFTIAKYFSLLELGIDENKLRLVYGKAVEYNQFHMVVAYYPTPNSVPLVLDNLDFRILPASQRPDIVPIYSFNGDNLWLSKKGRRSKLVGTSDRLGPWVKVKSRIGNQQVNIQ